MSQPISGLASLVAAATDVLNTGESDAEVYVNRIAPWNLHGDATAREAYNEAAAQLKTFEAAQEALSRAIHQKRLFMANLHNRQALVARLPPEILSLIFIEAFAEHIPAFLSFARRPETILPYLRTVTQICRVWRQIAISTSYLWSFICLDWSPAQVHIWLERAGDESDLRVRTSPLSFGRSRATGSLAKGSFDDLACTFNRWSTLVVPSNAKATLEHLGEFATMPSQREGGAVPNRLRNLRILDMEVTESSSADGPTLTIAEAFLRRGPEEHEPSLRPSSHDLLPELLSLTLWECPIRLHNTLQGVRALDVYAIVWLDWTSFRSALAEAPLIETLRISCMPPSISDTNLPIPLELPNLDDLTIGNGSHGTFLSSWFMNTIAPDLRDLHLEFSTRLEGESELEDLLTWVETFLRKAPRVASLAVLAPVKFLAKFLGSSSLRVESTGVMAGVPLLSELTLLCLDCHFLQTRYIVPLTEGIRHFILRSSELAEQGITRASPCLLVLSRELLFEDIAADTHEGQIAVTTSSQEWPSVWIDQPESLGYDEDFTHRNAQPNDEDDGSDGSVDWGYDDYDGGYGSDDFGW